MQSRQLLLKVAQDMKDYPLTDKEKGDRAQLKNCSPENITMFNFFNLIEFGPTKTDKMIDGKEIFEYNISVGVNEIYFTSGDSATEENIDAKIDEICTRLLCAIFHAITFGTSFPSGSFKSMYLGCNAFGPRNLFSNPS